jgi:hypothetical protein
VRLAFTLFVLNVFSAGWFASSMMFYRSNGQPVEAIISTAISSANMLSAVLALRRARKRP